MALRDAGDIGFIPEEFGYMYDYRKKYVDPSIIHFTCNLSPKIYDIKITTHYFYQLFPEFKYVEDGVKLIESIRSYF